MFRALARRSRKHCLGNVNGRPTHTQRPPNAHLTPTRKICIFADDEKRPPGSGPPGLTLMEPKHSISISNNMEEKKGVKWWIALIIAVLSAIAGAFTQASL